MYSVLYIEKTFKPVLRSFTTQVCRTRTDMNEREYAHAHKFAANAKSVLISVLGLFCRE